MLKNIIVRLSYIEIRKHSTITFSNLGRIGILGDYQKYIKYFLALVSPDSVEKIKCSSCTFENNIVFNENDLFNPDINVKLGVLYLDYLFDMFSDKNLVIIAYNAGPFRVKNWLENGEVYDKNNKINTPFKETNAYLNKVIADQKVYKLLLKE